MLTVLRLGRAHGAKGKQRWGDPRLSLEISGDGLTDPCNSVGFRFATFPQRGIRASWAAANLAHSPFLLTYLIFLEGLESFYR
jgi:hypothetical protein